MFKVKQWEIVTMSNYYCMYHYSYSIRNVNIFSYEAEIQFVHYKSSYDNYTHAVDDNQTDSLAIVAVFVAEVPILSEEYTPYPKAITELMNKAAELSTLEVGETLEMDVTLDQLITNIE